MAGIDRGLVLDLVPGPLKLQYIPVSLWQCSAQEDCATVREYRVPRLSLACPYVHRLVLF